MQLSSIVLHVIGVLISVLSGQNVILKAWQLFIFLHIESHVTFAETFGHIACTALSMNQDVSLLICRPVNHVRLMKHNQVLFGMLFNFCQTFIYRSSHFFLLAFGCVGESPRELILDKLPFLGIIIFVPARLVTRSRRLRCSCLDCSSSSDTCTSICSWRSFDGSTFSGWFASSSGSRGFASSSRSRLGCFIGVFVATHHFLGPLCDRLSSWARI